MSPDDAGSTRWALPIGPVTTAATSGSGPDVGANLLMGIESRTGWVHPFAEGKIQLHDRAMFQMIGGLNITLGSR